MEIDCAAVRIWFWMIGWLIGWFVGQIWIQKLELILYLATTTGCGCFNKIFLKCCLGDGEWFWWLCWVDFDWLIDLFICWLIGWLLVQFWMQAWVGLKACNGDFEWLVDWSDDLWSNLNAKFKMLELIFVLCSKHACSDNWLWMYEDNISEVPRRWRMILLLLRWFGFDWLVDCWSILNAGLRWSRSLELHVIMLMNCLAIAAIEFWLWCCDDLILIEWPGLLARLLDSWDFLVDLMLRSFLQAVPTSEAYRN